MSARGSQQSGAPGEIPFDGDASQSARVARLARDLEHGAVESHRRSSGWHERLSGRVEDDEFDAGADDAVRLVVEAQRHAGVDVFTDG